jgi:hypothetical protein
MAMTWVPDQRGLPRPEARALAAEADAAVSCMVLATGAITTRPVSMIIPAPSGLLRDENGGHKGLRRFTPTIR